jgi:hypothetical protein
MQLCFSLNRISYQTFEILEISKVSRSTAWLVTLTLAKLNVIESNFIGMTAEANRSRHPLKGDRCAFKE